MTISSDVLLVWLPIAVIVLFGLVGVFRGMWREVVVSLSIVLGTLIVQQWAERWAGDLHQMYSGLSQGQYQFWLSLVLFGLTVLVTGYLLSNQFVRRPLRVTDRLLGGLLGLMNGAAIVGSILLFIYVGLDNIQTTSPVYRNQISWSLMVWVGWFPVVVALVGAVIALIAPLRRARAAVAQPAPSTDWRPEGVPAGASATAPGPAPAPTIYTAPMSPQPAPSSQYAAPTPTPTPTPATTLPVREAAPAPEAEAQPAREVEAQEAQARVSSTPPAEGTTPPWSGPTEPSWLVGQPAPPAEAETPSTTTTTAPNLGAQVPDTQAPSSAPVPAYSASQQAAAQPLEGWQETQDTQQVQEEGGAQPEQAQAQQVSAPSEGPATGPLALGACPNCGAPVPEGANFCTECGTRLRP